MQIGSMVIYDFSAPKPAIMQILKDTTRLDDPVMALQVDTVIEFFFFFFFHVKLRSFVCRAFYLMKITDLTLIPSSSILFKHCIIINL